MTVSLLIICHDRLGDALLETAMNTLTDNPLPTRVISVGQNSSPESVHEQALRCLEQLDTGAGVLVLTDLFGSTPSNIACSLRADHNVVVVSGLNLPMLIRTLNYPDLALELLAEKAFSGGKDGVMYCAGEGNSSD